MQRIAWVTGSSSGIGLAIAQDLLLQGWAVTGFDIAKPALTHASFTAVTVDLSDTAALANALQNQHQLAVSPYAVVHAAGTMAAGALDNVDLKQSARMWQVHVAAATQVAQFTLPLMRVVKAGRLVLIGSRVASGMANRSQYAATKAALVSLTRSWAAEFVKDGITVNAVSPAATRTAMLDDPARANTAPRTPPIGRLIEPSEIAATVRFLLSNDAAAITGQNIVLCGGASLDY